MYEVEVGVSFEEFLRDRLPVLLRFAAVLCLDRGLAEDVVQEVLVRAQSRWPRIQVLDVPEAYVRRMIINEFLSWRRKWARIVPHADLPDGIGAADPAETHADRAELASELARLPKKQRAAVVLRYYGGLDDAEIASELGCTPGTVRSHLSRALTALRVEMAPDVLEQR